MNHYSSSNCVPSGSFLHQPPIFQAPIPQGPQVASHPGRFLSVHPVPGSCSCSFCTQNALENIAQNTVIQVPVQVNIPTGTPLALNPFYGITSSGPRRPFENELLSYPPPPYQYLPPSPRTGTKRTKREEDQNRASAMGLSKWFWKRRAEQLKAKSISKNKLLRNQRSLKRLNNNSMRREWKMERRDASKKRDLLREDRLEMLRRRRGIKRPASTKCQLWSCPRKQSRLNRSYLSNRSLSRLSNLSSKSRSPIVFNRSA